MLYMFFSLGQDSCSPVNPCEDSDVCIDTDSGPPAVIPLLEPLPTLTFPPKISLGHQCWREYNCKGVLG